MKKEENYIDLGDRGRFNKKNKLNELTGKEWIKFTKSWFIHRPPRRKEDEILHPAKYPESLVEEFISFFTKENDWVLDPFLGTGSTLIAAGNLNRNGIGVELNKSYFATAKKRVAKAGFENEMKLFNKNSLKLKDIIGGEADLSCIDYTITSPPYWNQLERNSMRQKGRKEKGLDTKYSVDAEDIGNLTGYDEFIEKQSLIFDQVYDITKNKGYLTIITNNIYYDGRVYPLAFDTATSLTRRGKRSWILKDEKIWLQDDKPLIALGINNAWVGNRHHQYCLIFRKEEE